MDDLHQCMQKKLIKIPNVTFKFSHIMSTFEQIQGEQDPNLKFQKAVAQKLCKHF